MVGMYLQNKKSKVGSMITCPVCGKRFFKKQYSQAFCSLHCKDSFWNSNQKTNDKEVEVMVMILLPVRLLQQETCLSIMIMDKDLESMSLAGKDGKRKRETQRNNRRNTFLHVS